MSERIKNSGVEMGEDYVGSGAVRGGRKMTALVFAINALVAGCCNDTNVGAKAIDPSVDARNEVPALAVNEETAVEEKVAARHVDLKKYEGLMPEIVQQKGVYEFPVPEALNMDDKEFEAFIGPLVETTRGLAKKLSVDLEKDGANKADLVRQFVYAIEAEMKKNPKGKEFIYSMKSKSGLEKGEYFSELMRHMAPVLMAGGYFVDAIMTGVFDEDQNKIVAVPSVMAAPIDEAKLYKVGDKKGSYDAPVAVLGEADVLTDKEKAVAFFIPSLEVVCYFKGDYLKRSAEKYREMGEFGLNPKNVSKEKMQKDYDTDTFNHEVTHIFLGKRYPTMGKAFGADVVMNMQLALPLGNGQMADLSGKMSPVNLHELCAVANELYQSEAEVPESLYRYVNSGRTLDPMSGYQLVSSTLPLVAITQAPDSVQKDRLIAALSANQKIDTLEINRLIRDTYTPDDVRALGGKLYEICEPRMQTAEAQLIELISNNPRLQ